MDTERPRRLTRRRLLAAGGAVGLGSLAGCIGSLPAGSEGTDDTTDESETATDASLGGHPAATSVDDQPRLGPPPTEAEGVVVAFEDPSCPRCSAFETGTVPKLRERLGDRVSVVFRSYPVVYPWGEPATQAIEAAFAREMGTGGTASAGTTTATTATTTATTTTAATATTAAESTSPGVRQGSVATWALIRHYFEEQGQFGAENVFERTRAFLAAETDLDADAVVADARNEQYDDAVQADLAAGEAADVGSTTPTVFLFRDGEFRTRAKGSISVRVVTAALDL